MTATKILLYYNISFINWNSGLGSKPTKVFMGGGEMEAFFWHFRGTEEIEEDVIPVIDHYLTGNPLLIDNDLTVGGDDYVEVILSGVRFINSETLIEEQLVPLDDFSNRIIMGRF